MPRLTVCLALPASAIAALALAAQSPARWWVDAKPTLTLGANDADTNAIFAEVRGATRLPNGQILVGDKGDYALRLFSHDGKLVRRFGRSGGGPGEIRYLTRLARCGDTLVTFDADGQRTTVFTLGGQYVRSFRFSPPQGGRPPYASACNAAGDFVHFSFESIADAKPGAYRPTVPLWLSKTDSAVVRVLANIPGSERYGTAVDGRMRNTRPLPLGKQTAIAMGADRIYVAAGNAYEILVFDLEGKSLPPIRERRPPVATTRADIDYAKQLEFALTPEPRRVQMEATFDTLPFPPTLPTYAALVVDADGNLWAEDYPRPTSDVARWTILDTAGRRIAEATLPRHLTVYEIGRDSVLGRYLDPEESIPQVRLYKLKRD